MKNVYKNVELIKTKKDLVAFIHELREDLKNNLEDWENLSLDSYLEAMAAWIGAMDNAYYNRGENPPENIF